MLPNVEFSNPLTASKNVFNPTNFTRKLVHIGAVAIKITILLYTLLFVLERKKQNG
jgi:hypothetical protein